MAVSWCKRYCLGPPPRQLEIGYQGTYLSSLRLVLVSRAFPSAMPVCSPRLLYRRLQDGGITVLDESQHLICLGPPRQLEIGYQGAYLRSLRLVLTLRASPSATPVCSPRSLSYRLQKRAEIGVSWG